MNKLAERQKELLFGNLNEQEYKIKQKEFLELYYKLRKKEESAWYSKLSLKQRKKIHKFILTLYKVKNRLGGFSYQILGDERTWADRPIIFVVTHVGKFDVEVVSEAIKDHYYLLSGDFEHIQGIMDVLFLGLNGVFYFNEKVKEDRKLVSKKMIDHLCNGGNLMYFIEGTWNITPNLPMLPCYWGIVDIAKEGNAIIVPIAAEQYGKLFKIKIGKNFDMNLYGPRNTEKSRAIEDLRDVISTLKWEIWETEKVNRKEIPDDYWDKYVINRFKEWPYFNEEYIDGLVYKPKGIYTESEVFEPIRALIPQEKAEYVVKLERNKVVAKKI